MFRTSALRPGSPGHGPHDCRRASRESETRRVRAPRLRSRIIRVLPGAEVNASARRSRATMSRSSPRCALVSRSRLVPRTRRRTPLLRSLSLRLCAPGEGVLSKHESERRTSAHARARRRQGRCSIQRLNNQPKAPVADAAPFVHDDRPPRLGDARQTQKIKKEGPLHDARDPRRQGEHDARREHHAAPEGDAAGEAPRAAPRGPHALGVVEPLRRARQHRRGGGRGGEGRGRGGGRGGGVGPILPLPAGRGARLGQAAARRPRRRRRRAVLGRRRRRPRRRRGLRGAARDRGLARVARAGPAEGVPAHAARERRLRDAHGPAAARRRRRLPRRVLGGPRLRRRRLRERPVRRRRLRPRVLRRRRNGPPVLRGPRRGPGARAPPLQLLQPHRPARARAGARGADVLAEAPAALLGALLGLGDVELGVREVLELLRDVEGRPEGRRVHRSRLPGGGEAARRRSRLPSTARCSIGLAA